jgi:two-component system response regulator YesN
LQQAGYVVYPAASPGEGYEVLRRTRVDMVLTDLNMPLGAGMEMVSIVRQEFPTTKILGVSAEASEFNPMQAAPILENVEVLPNPIGVHDLVATVQRVLQTP